MHLNVENNWLSVVLCLCGCNTLKPSKAAIVSHHTVVSSLDFPQQQKHRRMRAARSASGCGCGFGWRRARFRRLPGDSGCQLGWSGGNWSKAETTALVINHLPIASVRANPPSPQAPGFIRGDKPDIQKNELNSPHVRTNRSPMSPTR